MSVLAKLMNTGNIAAKDDPKKMKTSLIERVSTRVFLECDLVLAIGIGLFTGSLISATLLLLVCKIPSISF